MKRFIDFLKHNRLWNLILWVIIILFLVVSYFIISAKEKALRVSQIEVKIYQTAEVDFIDSNKVIELIKNFSPENAVLGTYLKNFQPDLLEKYLEDNPFVENADVSLDLSGKLIVKIKQRIPVLRIFTNNGQSYYVAKNGYKIPISSSFTPRVIAANGKIAESVVDSAFAKSQILRDLLSIALFCEANTFWKSQIEQLYVDNYMDILLVPKIGGHIIVFGSVEDMEEKFNKLKVFYEKGLNNVGWDEYSKINLKYKGQVVAERK
ncbi:MAG: cell division protein FtsQ [Bacteroidota bacterium]|nr:cell division protein FtsQ [Bacteroidota bacterium]